MLTPELENIAEIFKNEGFEIRLVGGCVRDVLRGVTPKDIDLCTDALPSEMIAIADEHSIKVIPTGLQHGTVTFVIDDQAYEITTLRIDAETDGRHANVEFTRSFEEDARRRDLTINAMSFDFNGNLYDYFGGREDLKNKVVRFVGNFEDRIREDYLRIFRYFRFASVMGADLDDDIKNFIVQDDVIEGMRNISKERIWSEFKKVRFHDHDLVSDLFEFINRVEDEELFRFPQDDMFDHLNGPFFEIARFCNDTDRFAEIFKISADEKSMIAFFGTVRHSYPVHINAFITKYPHLNEAVTPFVKRINLPHFEFDGSKTIPHVFPVSGKDLIAMGMKPGVNMGKILDTLKERWENSYFIISKENLLDGFQFFDNINELAVITVEDENDFEVDTVRKVVFDNYKFIVNETDAVNMIVHGKAVRV